MAPEGTSRLDRHPVALTSRKYIEDQSVSGTSTNLMSNYKSSDTKYPVQMQYEYQAVRREWNGIQHSGIHVHHTKTESSQRYDVGNLPYVIDLLGNQTNGNQNTS